MGRYFIETYGCQMNLADTETMCGILDGSGWSRTSEVKAADLIVVNTCSVREKAAERAIGHLQSMAALKKNRPELIIAIAGCLPQHRGPDLASRLPGVDLFIGPDNYRQLPEMLAGLTTPGSPGEHSGAGAAQGSDDGGELEQAKELDRFYLRPNKKETYGDINPVRERNVNAWISIMRGCDRLCTYCAVPLARGRERSLAAKDVIAAAETAVVDGFSAITLLGQAVTSYQDEGRDFTWLIDRLSRPSELRRLWFLSPHPADFNEEMLTLIGERPVFTRHLHLPLQAGSNEVLDRMRRGYTREEYLELVEMARRLIPDVAITTDIIVGFPGESAADFRATVSLMEAVRFDSAFMFAYSPRERTYSARFLEDDVPHEEKMARLREVIDLQEKHSWASYRALIGSTTEVLVKGPAKGEGERYFGRCRSNRATHFSVPEGKEPSPGDLVPVLVTDVTSHTLSGEMKIE